MWIFRGSATSSLVLSACRTEKRFYTAWAKSGQSRAAASGGKGPFARGRFCAKAEMEETVVGDESAFFHASRKIGG